MPTDIKPRILSTAINEEDATASVVPMEVAGYFELDAAKAKAIAAKVGKVVGKWREETARHDVKEAEIDRMVSAFEHADLEMAKQLI